MQIGKLISSFLPSVFLMLTPYSVLAKNLLADVEQLGYLSDITSVRDQGEHTYQFYVPEKTVVSIFLNGLSAGYQAQLLDNQGHPLRTTANHGTYWKSPLDTKTDNDAIVQELMPANYYIHITSTTINGNPLYKDSKDKFQLNLIPDNAPNLVIIAASDSSPIGRVDYQATGTHDEDVINKVIANINTDKGERILLRAGTFHISNNVLATRDNIIMIGTGWQTILRLGDGIKLYKSGLIRSRFWFSSQNELKPSFSNQHFMHFTLDGNKANKTTYDNDYATFGTYDHSIFEDIRVHDFPHYGFDPHGNPAGPTMTNHLIIRDSLSDHNEVDGIVFDATKNSLAKNNVLADNNRYGINLCTLAIYNKIHDNIIIQNGSHGVTIQTGRYIFKEPNYNSIQNNMILSNKQAGIFLFHANYNRIVNNIINNNGTYGITYHASSNNYALKNEIDDNSASERTGFSGIYLTGDNGVGSMFNSMMENSFYTHDLRQYKFAIAEQTGMADYNIINNNHFRNIARKLFIKGEHTTVNN